VDSNARESKIDFSQLLKAIRTLVDERDWQRFHTPKNLVMALSGEVGELNEIFQWLTDDEAKALKSDPRKFDQLCDELADVFYYTLRLSDVLGVDLEDAFWRKLNKTRQKYPVELAKGNATKYTDFNR
jgi:NTP pyrophosphatase (non-canonical NTP hydrolase)